MCASASQRLGNVVLALVIAHQPVSFRIAHLLHPLHQISPTIAVHRIAQPNLCLDFVALGNGDVSHVVSEARDFEMLSVVPGARRAGPGGQLLDDVSILPVADDYFAIQAQPAADESELAIAMGGLIEIHEIHVDRRPRQIAIELGMQVDKGFRERLAFASSRISSTVAGIRWMGYQPSGAYRGLEIVSPACFTRDAEANFQPLESSTVFPALSAHERIERQARAVKNTTNLSR
jgi:hypothetical protein